MSSSLDQLVGRNQALIRRAWATRMVARDIRVRLVVTQREARSAADLAFDLQCAAALGTLRRELYPAPAALCAVRAAIWRTRARRQPVQR
jgi:hypothetical protein